MVTNMDIMVTLGELWGTKLTVLWPLLTPSVVYRLTTLGLHILAGTTIISMLLRCLI